MKILALCNPTSGGKPQRLDELRAVAQRLNTAASAHMSVVASASAQAAELALAEHALGSDDVLLLSGGDGTIQHALSWLLTPEADGNRRACLLYTSPSPRDQRGSRMPSSA